MIFLFNHRWSKLLRILPGWNEDYLFIWDWKINFRQIFIHGNIYLNDVSRRFPIYRWSLSTYEDCTYKCCDKRQQIKTAVSNLTTHLNPKQIHQPTTENKCSTRYNNQYQSDKILFHTAFVIIRHFTVCYFKL